MALRRRVALIVPLVLALAVPACRAPADVPTAAPVGTEIGERAPSLAGHLPDGTVFELEAQPSGPTILVFYRSAECGLCRLQLEQMQLHLAAYRQMGAALIGVTLDPIETSRALAGQMQLAFPVVSVAPEVFATWSAIRAEGGLPLPATYIVDRERVIRFRHIGRNASDRTMDAGLLTVLGELTGS